jgi:hypothetical protein
VRLFVDVLIPRPDDRATVDIRLGHDRFVRQFCVYNSNPGSTLYSAGPLAGGAVGSANTPQSVGWILDGTNANSYLNEVFVNSAAYSVALLGTEVVPYIGANPSGLVSTGGPIAVIILSNQVISASNLTKLSAYLTAKYGIPL